MSEEVRAAEEPGDASSFEPKRSGWLLAALGTLIAGGLALGGWFALRETREPLRILVAVELDGHFWEGSRASARLLDQVAPQLKKLGFSPVEGGEVQVVEKLEGAASAEEAAERAGASFLVSGTLKLDVIEHPYSGGYVEARASGPLELAHRGGAKKSLGTVQNWSGAPKKEQAMALLAEGLGLQAFDQLLPGLMAHEAIQAIAGGSDRIAAAKLTSARAYLERRRSNLQIASDAYADLTRKVGEGDKSPTKISLHGALDRRENLSAVGAAGFLAMAEQARPFFSPISGELGFFEELEKLYWKGIDGKPRLVVETYNIAGYPSASPEGGTVVFVENLFGAAYALSAVVGAAPPKRVLVDEKRLFSEPKVAPGGKLAALWARTCPRCPSSLVVVDLATGKELHSTDPKLVSLGGFVWLGPAELGVLERRRAAEGSPQPDEEGAAAAPQVLRALDFSAAPAAAAALHTFARSESVSLPSANGDGTKVGFRRAAEDENTLAVFERGTKKLELFEIGGAYDPSISPAGDKLVFILSGHVFVLYIASKQTAQLTACPFEIRYPQFSLDGKRVFFEVRGKDPNFPKERAVSAVGSVPVP